MKITIKGASHEQVFDTENDGPEIEYRALLTIEIHNRDCPDDPWELIRESELTEEGGDNA